MAEPQCQILEPEEASDEGAAGAGDNGAAYTGAGNEGAAGTGAGDESIIKSPSFDSSWSFWCLLCIQQFDSKSKTYENDEDLQIHVKTLSHFTALRKVPKKILLSALPNGKYCSNCTQSLNQIHHVQQNICRLQLELGELEAKLEGLILERYNNLKDLPTIDGEVKEVNEFRWYLYDQVSASKSKSVQKNAQVSRRAHKSSRKIYLNIKIEASDQIQEEETSNRSAEEVKLHKEMDTDPHPNPPSPEFIIPDCENESEQNHTRLRSGSRIRKRTLKLVEADEINNQGTSLRNTSRAKKEKLVCSHNDCHKVFYAEGPLFVHVRKDHDGLEDPMKCELEDCGKTFTKPTQLLIHHRFHTGESPFTCHECGSKFKAKWYLQQHLKLHDGPNVCDDCGKRCASKQALELHITSHTQHRPFVCEICCASYKSNQYLLNHQANQHAGLLTNRPPIQCPTCSKLYSSASALRCHRLSAHGEGATQFTCDICKSIWNSKREHDKHYNVVHLNIKTIECPECPKKFSNKSNLRMHVQRHHSTKEERPRPFQCDACGKAFHLKATLENHIKIHSGQTPFPCTQCDKRFPSKSYLDLHIYTIHENRKRKTQMPEGHQRKKNRETHGTIKKKRSTPGFGRKKINIKTDPVHQPTIYSVIAEPVSESGIITLTPVVSTSGDGILNLITTAPNENERFDDNANSETQNVVTFSYI